MSYLLVGLLLSAYFIPLLWNIYAGIKDDNEFLLIFCWVPIFNLGFLGGHYEEKKEKRKYIEKKALGLAEIQGITDFYRVKIEFLDGAVYWTNEYNPRWCGYEERVISSEEGCERLISSIIREKSFTDRDETVYPYHTIKTLSIVPYDKLLTTFLGRE